MTSSGLLEVDGATLFYQRAGARGPKLVLLHGGMCSHRDWAKQVSALAEDHCVLATDLRGHGRSPGDAALCGVERWADDINALMDALDFGPTILVGHSLASRIVAQVAWRRPELVAGLIIVDGSRSHGGFAAHEPLENDAPPPMQASLSEILNTTIGPFADDTTRAHAMASMSSASPALMAKIVSEMKAWDLGAADRVFRGLEPDLPVLAIQSTYHDQFTPRVSLTSQTETTPYLAFLREALPQLDVAILPDTGHFSMMERPDQVTAFIRAFVKKTMPSPRRQ